VLPASWKACSTAAAAAAEQQPDARLQHTYKVHMHTQAVASWLDGLMHRQRCMLPLHQLPRGVVCLHGPCAVQCRAAEQNQRVADALWTREPHCYR
jgi:hypothetical protein